METDDLESMSPNKRPKTLETSKGKQKIKIEIEEEEIKEEKEEKSVEICGICFYEEGEAIRGWIDSCNHYFCFVCIMEWSKFESRCPLCKQRFNTIRRPPKQVGAFSLQQRIVNVPVRDQVWKNQANQTDPYAGTNCMECERSVDENLLLLCDLCDSAAHTYCVGLGYTVPEGDWYCHDCAISRNEHSRKIDNNDCSNQEDSKDLAENNVVNTDVSISEIVHESYFFEANVTSEGTSTSTDQLPSATETNGTNGTTATTKANDSSARTLRLCRNVHNRIRVLRDNWEALRNGSLNFSCNLPDSGTTSNKKQSGRREGIADKSNNPQSSSSNNCSQEATRSNGSDNNGPYDIDRAWKMLDIATSVQRARKCIQNKNHLSVKQSMTKEATPRVDKEENGHQPGKEKVSKEASQRVHKEPAIVSPSFSISKSKSFQQKEQGGLVPERRFGHLSPEIIRKKNLVQDLNGRKLSKEALKENLNYSSGSSVSHPLVSQAHTQENLCHENGGTISRSSSNISERSGNTCLIPVTESMPRASTHSGPAGVGSSGDVAELPVRENKEEKSSHNVMVRKDEEAKSEIQTLVKLNLKLLSGEKQLGVDRFKEVARLATHTILAACGLEHKRSSVRPIPVSICRHNAQGHQLPMSNLLKSSCRECFYAFVKDVVGSIMVEKLAVTTQVVKF